MQNGVRIIHMDFKHWCTTCNCHVAADEDSAAFSWSLGSLENKLSTITSKLNYSNRVHVLSYIPVVNSRNMNRAAACFCVWRRSRYLVSDFNLDPISVTGEEGQSPNVSSVTQHIYLLNTRSSIQTLSHTFKNKNDFFVLFLALLKGQETAREGVASSRATGRVGSEPRTQPLHRATREHQCFIQLINHIHISFSCFVVLI